VRLYFDNLCGKPFPLLYSRYDKDIPAAESIPTLVLYPMLALSLRTSSSDGGTTIATDLDSLTETAWSLLSARYTGFDIDEDYFEGLCLLAQVDFASKLSIFLYCLVADTSKLVRHSAL